MYGDDDVEKMYFKDVIKAPEGLALDETAEQRKEKTTRIHGATKYLIQIPNRAFLTFSNCTLEIVDSLYRYLDRADSISSRGKGYTPVLFSVLATEVDKNPSKIYYKETKGLMRPGSDLEWLLNLFFPVEWIFKRILLASRLEGYAVIVGAIFSNQVQSRLTI